MLLLLVMVFETLFHMQIVQSFRVSEKIYDQIQGNTACFKRLNSTTEVGCTSKLHGNVGIIHLIEEQSDLDWVIEKGPHSPYILGLSPKFFTKEVLISSRDSGKLAGVVLINDGTEVPPSFSGDKLCPNQQSSLYRNTDLENYCTQNPWNPYGSSLIFENWDFPIFLLDDEDSINKTRECFNEFNQPDNFGNPRDWPLCAMELKSNMYAATNSEVCMRRSRRNLIYVEAGFCEPLEDYNIWNSIHPLNSDGIKEDSIILVSTPGDASSQFDNRSPGAESAVSGLVTLLVTADALYNSAKTFNDDLNVIFAIFQGESWDYIGSSRMVYDMERDQFPHKEIENQDDQMTRINISHIGTVIDLRQVGLGTESVYIHTDPISNKIPSIQEKTKHLTNILSKTSKSWNVSFEEVDQSNPLPPSSLHTFLKAKNISGVFISDHEKEYRNQYFQSIFDDYKNLNFLSTNESTDALEVVSTRISQIAGVLASSLYSLLNEAPQDLEANVTLTNKLLYCYLKNVNCSFFQQFCDRDLLKTLYKGPARMYISVKKEQNYLPYITGRILSYLTGEIVINYDESNCTSNSSQVFYLTYYPFIEQGVCIRSTVHYTQALSPAFLTDDYDWGSGKYSTWTESIWYNTGARIFLRPSFRCELALVLIGLLCIALSILLVHFFNSRANILFTCDIVPAPI